MIKPSIHRISGLTAILVFILVGSVSVSCVTDSSTNTYEEPQHLVPFGSVLIAPETHELVMTGYVNMAKGVIELFSCGPGGKTHESAFVMFADPKDVQAGLLLLGLEHGLPMPGLGQEPPTGDEVGVYVVWEQDGKYIRRDAASLLVDYQGRIDLEDEAWIFNGSTIEDGLFMAGAEESLIATYWDPWAIINISSELGRDDERIMLNAKLMPPLHTWVKLVINAGQSQ